MAFKLPYQNLNTDFERAANTGNWLQVGLAVNRNFDELDREVSKQLASLKSVIDVLSSGATDDDDSSVNTTSTSYVDLGGPEVTFTIPPSGRFWLFAGSNIASSCTSAAIIGGSVGYTLNGGSKIDFTGLSMGSNSGNESIQNNSSRIALLSGFTPGTSMTIRLWYKSLSSPSGNTATFDARFVSVQPLV